MKTNGLLRMSGYVTEAKRVSLGSRFRLNGKRGALQAAESSLALRLSAASQFSATCFRPPRRGQALRQLLQGEGPQDHSDLRDAGSQKLPKLLPIFGRYLHLKGASRHAPV